MTSAMSSLPGAREVHVERTGGDDSRLESPGIDYLLANTPHLLGYYLFHTRSRVEAEELVDETLRIALHPPSTLELDRGSAAAWLYGLAQYVLRRHEAPLAAPRPANEGGSEDLSRLERELLALKSGGFADADIVEITGLRKGHINTLLDRARRKARS